MNLKGISHVSRDVVEELQREKVRELERSSVLLSEALKQAAILRGRLAAIAELSDVGMMWDGHDELNEDTHEANEQHAIGLLDRIYAIATGAETDV